MKLRELLNESTAEMTVDIKPLSNNRTLFTGFAKHGGTIVSKFRNSVVCEITTEIKKDSVFIGYVESTVLQQGWATKLLAYVVNFYKARGDRYFTAYIPHGNTSSESLFKKSGFTPTTSNGSGTIWELQL